MAPLGISLVNLLIESSSLSCLAEGRQTKKEQGFAQNSSSDSSRETSTSPPSSNTTNLFFGEGGSGSIGGGTTAASNGTTSSKPFSKATLSSFRTDDDGIKLNNNNNYFSEGNQRENAEKGERRSSAENNFREGEPTSSSTQKLYSIFWEKFKKPYDQKEANTTYRPFSPVVGPEGVSQESEQKNNGKADHFKNVAKSAVSSDDKLSSSSSSSTYKKFYEKAQQINSQLLPVWSLLSYPSDLHYYGRAAVMTVVTANVIGKTLEKLPDIEELGKRYGPLFQCNLLDGSNPNQPGRVGVDKDFF